jgi:hypothetical protein
MSPRFAASPSAMRLDIKTMTIRPLYYSIFTTESARHDTV